MSRERWGSGKQQAMGLRVGSWWSLERNEWLPGTEWELKKWRDRAAFWGRQHEGNQSVLALKVSTPGHGSLEDSQLSQRFKVGNNNNSSDVF